MNFSFGLEHAALLGRSFDHGLLAEGVGGPVTPALQKATDPGVLQDDPERPGYPVARARLAAASGWDT